jgi:hypothetical protein
MKGATGTAGGGGGMQMLPLDRTAKKATSRAICAHREEIVRFIRDLLSLFIFA